MLFFGGYSSILPYLLYLSVVWVCILVGIKGEIWRVMKSESTTEQVISRNFDDQQYIDNYILTGYEIIHASPEKNGTRNALLNQEQFIYLRKQSYYWKLHASNWLQPFANSSPFLRGPPVFSTGS